MSDSTTPQDGNEMPPASAGSTAWMISLAWPFSAITVAGVRAKVEPGFPSRFIPVFNTRAEAVAWYGKDNDSIQPLRIGEGQSQNARDQRPATADETTTRRRHRGSAASRGSRNMKRMFLIRHVRWLWLNYRFAQHLAMCQKVGLGCFPAPSDLVFLDRVWRGDA